MVELSFNSPDISQNPSSPEKESFSVPDLDIAIVFGQGPVKPVLIPSELSDEQKKSWAIFKTDPLRMPEPDFHVIEGQSFLQELTDADNAESSEKEKEAMKAQIRTKWQHMGRFGLNLRARHIALAAGAALVSGKTKEVVLTGGSTIPGWRKKDYENDFLDTDPEVTASTLPAAAYQKRFDQFLKYEVLWPSEAELMNDIIERNFAGSYKAKYGRDITSSIRIEADASNTLENIVLSINKNSGLVDKTKRIGVLAFDPHVKRAATIANMYGIVLSDNGTIASQEELVERARTHHKKQYEEALTAFADSTNNPLIEEFEVNEDRLLLGLTETPFLAYWIGYTFGLDDPELINKVMLPLLHDPKKAEAVEEVFSRVGVSLDGYKSIDLARLAEENPSGYTELRHRLLLLNTPEMRPILPSRDDMKNWDADTIL